MVPPTAGDSKASAICICKILPIRITFLKIVTLSPRIVKTTPTAPENNPIAISASPSYDQINDQQLFWRHNVSIRELTVGVHELLEVIYHPKDLGFDGTSAARAHEGIQGHRLIRDRRSDNYQTETAIEGVYAWDSYRLTVKGRIDGLIIDGETVWAEEIKTTYAPLHQLTPDTYPVHLAQLQLYLYFLMVKYPDKHITGNLTYLNLDDLSEITFPVSITAATGEALFTSLAVPYIESIRDRDSWRTLRNRSLASWPFPFPSPRPGQEELIETMEYALESETDLFLEAATGIGKTIGVLYPALKRLSQSDRYDQIFFLTAKTAGKEIVKKTLSLAMTQGIRLRTVFIEAKERVCLYPEAECRPESCPCAAGYYLRVKSVIPELLQKELILPETLLEYSRSHQVCPFELSLDLSLASDLIVCDYNYVFDPAVYLKRFFLHSGRHNFLFLIDEAHNLVTRGREMYSARLDQSQLIRLREHLNGQAPAVEAASKGVETFFHRWQQQLRDEGRKGMLLQTLPEMLESALEKLAAAIEPFLRQTPFKNLNRPVQDFYFELLHLIRVIGYLRPEYAIYILIEDDDLILRLFCRNPGPLLRQRLDWARSAVFFSATLSPLEYFQKLLGGKPDALSLRLTSPFPRENRLYLHIPGIDTRYKKRDESAAKIATIAVDMALTHQGNYLVFFPSYAYLNSVRPLIQHYAGDRLHIYSQFPGMNDAQKLKFLWKISTPSSRSNLGLAVLGGLFGEGVDLPGEQLVGVMIVGPGLPTVSAEQELIQAYFDETENGGFLYAYVIPGMIRVIQSAGRVFRTPDDRGVVILVDDRFLYESYQALMPPDWFLPGREFSSENYLEILEEFWNQ